MECFALNRLLLPLIIVFYSFSEERNDPCNHYVAVVALLALLAACS